MTSLISTTKSKLLPLIETIFDNKGGEYDQWKASAKIINENTDE